MAEVLENLDFSTEDDEKDPIKSETTIVVLSPQEAYSDLSEEDSVDKDPTEYVRSNLGRSYCVLKQKLMTRCNNSVK